MPFFGRSRPATRVAGYAHAAVLWQLWYRLARDCPDRRRHGWVLRRELHDHEPGRVQGVHRGSRTHPLMAWYSGDSYQAFAAAFGVNPNVAFVVDDAVSEGAAGTRFVEIRGQAER